MKPNTPSATPAASETQKLWEHITQLHRKHTDLLTQMHGKTELDPNAPLDTSSVRALAASISALADVLAKPWEREGEVTLPEGVVKMKIRHRSG